MTLEQAVRGATLTLFAVSAVCLVGDALALHDIAADYVSPHIVAEHALTLPEWTACVGEWSMVNFSVLPILGFYACFLWERLRAAPGSPNASEEGTR